MKRLTIVSILVALWCAALTSSATSTADAAPASRDRRVYVVSESVGLGARTALPQAFGPEWQVTVDGTPALFVEQLESQHVRRRMATDPSVFGDVAVVAGGHNYPYWDPARFDRSIDSMMGALREAGVTRVFWVTLREVKQQFVSASAWRGVQPYFWYFPEVNDHLEAALSRHPDLTLVDWTSAADRPDITYDAIHLNQVGARVYSELIRDTVLGTLQRTPIDTTTAITVAGRHGVPAGATAVAVNLTVDRPRSAGFLTAFGCGGPAPLASNANFVRDQVVAAAAIVPVGADGSICLRNSESTHLVVDVTGAFPVGGGFVPVGPVRLADTREPASTGRPPGGTVVRVPVAATSGVPAGARAVALSVTATDAAAAGFVSVGPCDRPLGTTSNVNVTAGGTAPNLVITETDATGAVCVVSNIATHLLVDLLGAFGPASDMGVVDATRLLDTREGSGANPGGAVLAVPVAGRAGVPADATGVALNLTAASPAAAGFVTVWPCDRPRPTASNLNVTAGTDRANLVLVAPDGDGEVCVFTSGTTHVVVDVFGWFGDGFVGTTPTRVLDTRP
ncbi:MAG: hypothetical protein KDB40_18650 [Acidimicrobiales bacterium]|nr:hypothetical protein [Acidimicrobiales bacterium]MCB9393993.1 hypothetical protein [Acidimicrobiaceae bacterium]